MAESYLVIGGSGFLGRHIVEALLARGDKNVAVFDLVQRHFDVTFYGGDITNEQDVGNAIQKSGATCIFHTVAPNVKEAPPPGLFYKVNVVGTKTVLAAAAAHRVKKVVYTSSAGNVYDGSDLVDCDERMPVPEKQSDEYNLTKAQAEALVLAANGQDGLYTTAIRPAGIFGPGDRQLLPGLVEVAKNKQWHWQIGDNVNLFDWTYVGNVAKAHLLAADKLLDAPLPIEVVSQKNLPDISLTTGKYTIPTSESRPPGPALTITPEIEKAYFNFKEGAQKKASVRGKFDPLIPENVVLEPTYPLQVAGQAFFITNGEPLYIWDFFRAVWTALGYEVPKPSRTITVGRGLGLFLGTMSEWAAWLLKREPGFSRGRIYYVTSQRYFNIEKARRVLGYEPDVGIEEGIKRTAAWWKEAEAAKAATKA